ncbi:MAG: hypothetical protein JHC26_10675 [Thermofilum sp.]|jgi:septal ring factor EnvC (AmiA/AmiB activator)|uniref:hypothetical protein n=1 Tax=Thermofilum sp. TaxID=1961369 RepID=UPI0025835DC2|nr:hypothetical protein [Thermofilum sp.]MCI4409545.1 hypothetical protein [Thermofilum sp.]
MSEKLQLIRELWNMAKDMINPPAKPEESPEEKRIKTSIEALKDIADIALKIEQVETTIKATTTAISSIEEEIKRQRTISILAILVSSIAVLLVILLK